MNEARLTVLSGPSGVGKGTVVSAVRRLYPQVWVSVSVTTRKPRPGEIDGVHYRFVTRAQFDAMTATGELLEYAEFAGNLYGTPRAPVQQRRGEGLPTLLEIELQGARQVRAADPQAHLVFLVPPSWDELERAAARAWHRVRRTYRRPPGPGPGGAGGRDRVRCRVVNDDVERAAAELVSLIESVCPDRGGITT